MTAESRPDARTGARAPFSFDRSKEVVLSKIDHKARWAESAAKASISKSEAIAARATAFVPTSIETTLIDVMPAHEIVRRFYGNADRSVVVSQRLRERTEDLEYWKAHRCGAAALTNGVAPGFGGTPAATDPVRETPSDV